jgi:hypothetical protein
VEEGETEWERRFAELGARMSDKINESVYGSLERKFGVRNPD